MFIVVVYIKGLPNGSAKTSAASALEMVRQAQARGQHAEIYDSKSRPATLHDLQRAAAAEKDGQSSE